VKCIQRRKRHRIRSWSTGIFMLLIAIDYRKYYWLTRTTPGVPGENNDQDKNMKTKTPIAVRTKTDSIWHIMAHLDSPIPHSTNLDGLTSL
jgi:hypothetical protein